jgi:phosphomethylpyrimidine synthase
MKITQDVRDYAQKQGVGEREALDEGMQEMSKTFRDKGGEIYSNT